jgi:hypothetical protein
LKGLVIKKRSVFWSIAQQKKHHIHLKFGIYLLGMWRLDLDA